MLVEMIGNHGLPAFVHMHMLDGLLARLVEPCQCLQRGAAGSLGLERQPHVRAQRAAVP